MTQPLSGPRIADNELLSRYCASKDQEAFGQLVGRHLGWVYGTALRLTRDSALAEDVAQGVFLALTTHAAKLSTHQNLAGWLFEAARFGSLTALRQRRRQKERERMASQQPAPDRLSDLERADLAEHLDSAVHKLPRADRALILAHFYEQVDVEEIAGRLQITRAAAQKRLERAIDKLRHHLGAREPAQTFAAALTGIAAVRAPSHLTAALLAGKTTPAAVALAGSIHWLLGLGAKLLWIGATVTCVVAAFTVVAVQHRTAAIPPAVTIPIAAPASSAAGGTTGEVVGSDGKALANADVIISAFDHSAERVIARTRTDAAGSFTLPSTLNSHYAYAYVAGVGISPSGRQQDLPLRLQVAPAADVQITLIDPTGAPAANIPVRPIRINFPDDSPPVGMNSTALPTEVGQSFGATTDAQGKCILHGLPRNSEVRLDVEDSRFAHLPFNQVLTLSGDDKQIIAPPIHLVKAAELRGVLLTPDSHKALLDVEIDAQASHANPFISGGSATTDEQGAFTLSRLPPGAFVVSIGEPANRSNAWVAPALEVALQEGEHRTLEFALSHGGILDGQVRDASTGKPVTGMNIALHGSARPQTAASVYSHAVGADGRFEFRVPPGIQHPYVQSIPDGYLHPQHQAMKAISVAEGQTVTVNFDLEPDTTPTVEGTVLDPDGNPVAGATVTYFSNEDAAFPQSAKTDAHGQFEIHAAAGTPVRATWKTFATTVAQKVKPGIPLELTLAADTRFSLVVHLTDEDGNVVPGAQADLIKWGPRTGAGGQPRAANKDGTVTFENLSRDGKYSISAKAPGYGGASGDLKRSPATGDSATLRIRLKKASSVIAGRVVDAYGKPLPNIEVEMNGDDYVQTRTDAAGHFSFSVTETASALIYLRSAPGTPLKPIDAKAGQTDLTLTAPEVNPAK